MTTIERALNYLYRTQLPHGEFPAYASSDPAMVRDCVLDSTPFITALIASSLTRMGHPLAREMVDNAAGFLMLEMEGPGLWRYWSSRNARHRELEPDLDDTCCAAHALRQAGREVPDNTPVLLANRSPEGLFYTYIAPRTGSPPQVLEAVRPLVDGLTVIKLGAAGVLHEVDPVVQANVLLWLGERLETQPVSLYLRDLLRGDEDKIASRYYHDRLAFYYFVSRAYSAGCDCLAALRRETIARVEARLRAGTNTPLATALAACTLLNFRARGTALTGALDTLTGTQQAGGSWQCGAFYAGGTDYHGSAGLTTAFCLEALALSRGQ
jgi:hypothetical protein